MEDKIFARMVIELMGRPPEHIKEAMNSLLEKMSSERGIKIKEKRTFDPKKIEKSKDLYTTFSEIEAEFDNLDAYFGILFAYMPSHVEIVSPEKIRMDNVMLNQLGNALVNRLHQYDAIAKQMIAERDILAHTVKQLKGELPKEIITMDKKEDVKENKKSKDK